MKARDDICQRCAHPASDELGQLLPGTVGPWKGRWHFPCIAAARQQYARELRRPLERR